MIENLRRKLAAHNCKRLSNVGLIPSAIVLPVFLKNGEYYILFIKRAETVKDHKGQISFPGGRYEEQDRSLLETALRECEEEIGLPKEKIEVLGELDECATRTTNYRIATFVSLISYPFNFTLDKHEIEKIIEIPISAFSGYCGKAQMKTRDGTPEYYYEGECIWGATAIILKQFLELIDPR